MGARVDSKLCRILGLARVSTGTFLRDLVGIGDLVKGEERKKINGNPPQEIH